MSTATSNDKPEPKSEHKSEPKSEQKKSADEPSELEAVPEPDEAARKAEAHAKAVAEAEPEEPFEGPDEATRKAEAHAKAVADPPDEPEPAPPVAKTQIGADGKRHPIGKGPKDAEKFRTRTEITHTRGGKELTSPDFEAGDGTATGTLAASSAGN